MTRVERARHLGGRFVESVTARAVDSADVAWVASVLTPAELAVWETLGTADRSESVAVARRTRRALGVSADHRYLAAALLHDAGKTPARLGPAGRVYATVVAGLAGHRRARRFDNRVGLYVSHDDLGARLLAGAGARPEAVAWARAHHRRELWPGTGIPLEICSALAAADGE